MLAFCSNPRYSWVTYFILSNFCNFSQLVLSTHPLLFYRFFSTYQSFEVLSNFCQFLTHCYQFTFYVIWQPRNAPAVHTKNTTLSFLSYRAHALCSITLSQLHRRLWPSWNFDMGGSRHGWGFPLRTMCYASILCQMCDARELQLLLDDVIVVWLISLACSAHDNWPARTQC